jgi:hypothetical protein
MIKDFRCRSGALSCGNGDCSQASRLAARTAGARVQALSRRPTRVQIPHSGMSIRLASLLVVIPNHAKGMMQHYNNSADARTASGRRAQSTSAWMHETRRAPSSGLACNGHGKFLRVEVLMVLRSAAGPGDPDPAGPDLHAGRPNLRRPDARFDTCKRGSGQDFQCNSIVLNCYKVKVYCIRVLHVCNCSHQYSQLLNNSGR